MPIINIQVIQAGLVGVLPSLGYLNTSDTVAQVTTTGYLNKEVANGLQISLPCIMAVSTQASQNAIPQVGWYQVQHVGTNWSLITPTSDLLALPAGEIYVGNSGDEATAVAMSGDATISDTGVLTVSPLSISGSKMANHTVDYTQMALEVAALQSLALTSTQIKSLYTTPFQIIAAPGAGKFVIVDKVLYDISFVTTQYTDGGNIFAQFGNTTHGGAPAASNVLSASDFNAVAASTLITVADNGINVASATAENSAVYLANDTQAFATGDSTLHVYIFYRIYAPA